MSATIENGDFRQLSQSIADRSIDLILTDPPYPREYLPLWSDLADLAARVLRPGRFLIAYTGQMYLEDVMHALSARLRYYWLGTLHHIGAVGTQHARRMMNAAKPILYYTNGEAVKHAYCYDYLKSPQRDKRFHHWGQSLGPVRYLVETFTRPGDLVLDPFTGGGTTALACAQTGRRFLGYEIDPQTAERARARLADFQPLLFDVSLSPTQLSTDIYG